MHNSQFEGPDNLVLWAQLPDVGDPGDVYELRLLDASPIGRRHRGEMVIRIQGCYPRPPTTRCLPLTRCRSWLSGPFSCGHAACPGKRPGLWRMSAARGALGEIEH